jgi:hypothetical protein
MSANQSDMASKMRRCLNSQQLQEILHDYDVSDFSDTNSSGSISDNENEELHLLVS